MSVLILSPTYRWQECSAHSAAIFRMGRQWPDLFTGYIPMHGNPVSHARELLMGGALASNARMALWVDADVWWPQKVDHDICRVVERELEDRRDGSPVIAPTTLLAFPCRQRDGKLNRIPHKAKPGQDLEWTGFGMVLMDLDWYRIRWPAKRAEELPWFDFVWTVLNGQRTLMTEDVRHCQCVRTMGGTIRCAGVAVEHAPGELESPDAR